MNPKKNRSIASMLQQLEKHLKNNSHSVYVCCFTKMLEDYPTEVAAYAVDLLKSRKYTELLSWADTIGNAVHANAEDAFSASQLVAFIKKYPFPAPELKVLARAKAVDKFLAAENRCKKYNLKFLRRSTPRWDPDTDVLQRMSGWIAYVIGNQPDLARVYQECDFGPGASVGVHGDVTNMARKFLSPSWSCTPSALPYAVSALAQDPLVWELLNPDLARPVCYDILEFRKEVENRVQLVQNNKIVFVPKTTLVDRTIAVEPLLNGYVQKGTDIFMRRCLKRVGLDLSSQERNQELARLGSLPGQSDPFVTIDLSAASDSIATEVVRRLVPPDWFEFLNSIRSKGYELDGAVHRYEKFTSMGNGFCFPLETLIFASVCHVYCSPGDFVVYGDDIIVRRSVSKQVIATLWKLGFRHNTEKTFLEGDFRESCGADWFSGRDIRPLTLDYAFDSAENIIKFYNMSMRKPLWFHAFRNVREYLLELIPKHQRLVRPYKGVEYSAFEVSLDMFMTSPFARWDRKIRAWSWLEVMVSSVPDKDIRKRERYQTALMMGALSGVSAQCPFAKRRKTSRTVRRTSHAGATCLWLPTDLQG